MRDGLIQQVSTPLELNDYPVNRFVAGFIGNPAMNFLRMRLDADGKRLHGDFGTIDLPQGLLAAAQGYRDRDLWVGVRPEHLSISTPDTSTDVLAGTTELIEPLGSAIEKIGRASCRERVCQYV